MGFRRLSIKIFCSSVGLSWLWRLANPISQKAALAFVSEGGDRTMGVMREDLWLARAWCQEGESPSEGEELDDKHEEDYSLLVKERMYFQGSAMGMLWTD